MHLRVIFIAFFALFALGYATPMRELIYIFRNQDEKLYNFFLEN